MTSSVALVPVLIAFIIGRSVGVTGVEFRVERIDYTVYMSMRCMKISTCQVSSLGMLTKHVAESGFQQPEAIRSRESSRLEARLTVLPENEHMSTLR